MASNDLVDRVTLYQGRLDNPQDTKNTEQSKDVYPLNHFLDMDVDGGTGGVSVPKKEAPHALRTGTIVGGAPLVQDNITDQKEDIGVPSKQENRHPTTSGTVVGPTAPVRVTAQGDRDTPNLKEQEQMRQDSSTKIHTGPPGNSAGVPSVHTERSSSPNASFKATMLPQHLAQSVRGSGSERTNPLRIYRGASSTSGTSRATGSSLHIAQNTQESGSFLPYNPLETTRHAEPSWEARCLPISRPSDDSRIAEPQDQGNMPSGSRPLQGRELDARVGRGGGRGWGQRRGQVTAPGWDVGLDRQKPWKRGNGWKGSASGSRNGSMSDKQGQQAPVKPSSTPEQNPELLSESTIRELEETIREKDEQISQLKGTISHLHQREGDPPKSDRELAIGFSDVAHSIDQLVLQYCVTPQNPDIKSYSPELRASFDKSSCQPDKHLRSGHKMKMISSVLARLLCDLVFDGLRSDLVGSRQTTGAVKLVVNKLKGTLYQRDRWRAVTVGLLTTGDDFMRAFNERVDRITVELAALLSALAPSEDDSSRRVDALRAIVRQTSKLAVEVRKQTDKISLDHKTPGSPYDPQCMEDMSCCHPPAVLVELRATVQIQIFPAIVRRPCGWDEHSQIEPTVVLKAKVMAEPPPREVYPEDNWQ
ncbi:hypothetical protein DFP73DRAFT_285262 [Morchella snyderi]|nr:hypothetical protein DFP73DRAFT_285262 [Morchella snyderi]